MPIRKLSDTTYRYQNVALVEAIVWAINSINNRSDILANLTLGNNKSNCDVTQHIELLYSLHRFSAPAYARNIVRIEHFY